MAARITEATVPTGSSLSSSSSKRVWPSSAVSGWVDWGGFFFGGAAGGGGGGGASIFVFGWGAAAACGGRAPAGRGQRLRPGTMMGLLPGGGGAAAGARAAYQSKRDAGVSSFGTPGSRAPRRRASVGGLAFAYPSRVPRDRRATEGLESREAPARPGAAAHCTKDSDRPEVSWGP